MADILNLSSEDLLKSGEEQSEKQLELNASIEKHFKEDVDTVASFINIFNDLRENEDDHPVYKHFLSLLDDASITDYFMRLKEHYETLDITEEKYHSLFSKYKEVLENNDFISE